MFVCLCMHRNLMVFHLVELAFSVFYYFIFFFIPSSERKLFIQISIDRRNTQLNLNEIKLNPMNGNKTINENYNKKKIEGKKP